MKGLILIITLCLYIIYTESYIVNPGPYYLPTKGKIWPMPQFQSSLDDYFVVDVDNFLLKATGANCKLLNESFVRYYEIIKKNRISKPNGIISNIVTKPLVDESYLGELKQLNVNLTGKCNDNDQPSLDMDESYFLGVLEDTELSANSIWGILRGLESFSQLLYLGDDKSSVLMNATVIIDYPRFKHRGLLLDTSRHYIPLDKIYDILDAMVYNKLNVFHWHIVDDQSFPYVSKKFPELSQQGAYDPTLFVYTAENISAIIDYARKRGVRVMPEFDTPGHTRSWGVSHPELLTKCDGVQKGAYGPMDPSKNTTYSFLKDLFAEVREVFTDQFIHLGGDEVDFDCWQLDPNINDFMKQHSIANYSALESYYIQKVIDIVDEIPFSSVVWEEVFENGVTLPNKTIVHVWKDFGTPWNQTLYEVTADGKFALLSACWYLDHLSNGGDWTKFYQCDPTNFGGSEEQLALLLGGEACMWAEAVNEYNVVQRIFPRASATAEKLWSNNDNYDLEEVARRLEEHTCRMNRRGIAAQPPNAAGFCL
ncbi:unnamed protein product [Ceutorhynchus assimilis]|uniref:Beta-hexosaminidase n=1 Tax=Ceutorhynchus assimilis TaxID=467358 RepID=A0A9P0DHB5_9CUCU|nr:unnamed protein product [Ceutorhynchus assimilis]